MGDIWIRDIEITTLIAVASVFVVLPVQLLLCFKAKSVFLRLLPAILLTATTVFLFVMMTAAKDWDALGYAILGAFSGVLLLFSGIGWGIWATVKWPRSKKNPGTEYRT